MENNKFEFVGAPCGHHGPNTFYKAVKYYKDNKYKILSLGESFFVKIWNHSDLVSIGELRLLWEDKDSNQILTSLRLYFLPENTPEGRTEAHGEDEVIAISEKVVLRLEDTLEWIADGGDARWQRGLEGTWERDCAEPPSSSDQISQKFTPYNGALNFEDVLREKQLIGDVPDPEGAAVLVLSYAQYCRYRAALKRLEGVSKKWLRNTLVVALGGFCVPTKTTHILFCRDTFDYPELECHELLCNHLAPKLKGRPRKKRKKRSQSPDSESNESESSSSTVGSVAKFKKTTLLPGRQQLKQSLSPTKSLSCSRKNGMKKDLLPTLCHKNNSREERHFIRKLLAFMQQRKTPIERVPHLGFKQVDLFFFYKRVEDIGGYEAVMAKKMWKTLYDELGGHPGNTSAATCTRRHYEKFLLPFERYMKGEEYKPLPPTYKRRPKLKDEDDKTDSGSVVSGEQRQDSPTSPECSSWGSPPGKRGVTHLEETKVALKNRGVLVMELLEHGEDSNKNIDVPMKPSSEECKNIEATRAVVAPSKQAEEASGSPKQSMCEVPKSLAETEKKDLRLNDLVKITNSMEKVDDGQSALQNLAKIASRIDIVPKDKGSIVTKESQALPSRGPQDGSSRGIQDVPSAKKIKVESSKAPSSGSSVQNVAPRIPVPHLDSWLTLSPNQSYGPLGPIDNQVQPSFFKHNMKSGQLQSAMSPSLFQAQMLFDQQGSFFGTQRMPEPAHTKRSPGQVLDLKSIGSSPYSLLEYYARSMGTSHGKLNGALPYRVPVSAPSFHLPPGLVQSPSAYSKSNRTYDNPALDLKKYGSSDDSDNIVLDLSKKSQSASAVQEEPLQENLVLNLKTDKLDTEEKELDLSIQKEIPKSDMLSKSGNMHVRIPNTGNKLPLRAEVVPYSLPRRPSSRDPAFSVTGSSGHDPSWSRTNGGGGAPASTTSSHKSMFKDVKSSTASVKTMPVSPFKHTVNSVGQTTVSIGGDRELTEAKSSVGFSGRGTPNKPPTSQQLPAMPPDGSISSLTSSANYMMPGMPSLQSIPGLLGSGYPPPYLGCLPPHIPPGIKPPAGYPPLLDSAYYTALYGQHLFGLPPYFCALQVPTTLPSTSSQEYIQASMQAYKELIQRGAGPPGMGFPSPLPPSSLYPRDRTNLSPVRQTSPAISSAK